MGWCSRTEKDKGGNFPRIQCQPPSDGLILKGGAVSYLNINECGHFQGSLPNFSLAALVLVFWCLPAGAEHKAFSGVGNRSEEAYDQWQDNPHHDMEQPERKHSSSLTESSSPLYSSSSSSSSSPSDCN
mmetsp:Transcript_3717/g.7938  ORF Transcript_3717/g.7938 Transcript_3717/m.7938 type:complete len:129 (-) Transcript_3717:95-481(-)